MPRRNRDNIVIAVPKGRVLEQLSARFEKAGISTEALTAKSRKLVREDKEAGLSYLLLKPDDVPTYVEYGLSLIHISQGIVR